jgi:hypothetical protein
MATKVFGLLVLLAFAVACQAAQPNFHDLVTSESNAAIRFSHLHSLIIRAPAYPLPPALTARALAIVNTAMYDAWSFYTPNKASPSIVYSGINKRSGKLSDKEISVSVAAWGTLKRVYEGTVNSASVNAQADALLFQITGLTNPTSRNANSAVGLGNRIADGLNAFRDNDGANSLGDKPFTKPAPNGSRRYQDYTNYFPVNEPYDIRVPRTEESCSKIRSLNKWEPLTTPTDAITGAGSITRPYASPFAADIIPFAMTSGSQFRTRGPPVHEVPEIDRMSFEEQHIQVLTNSSNLGDREKMIAEFWAPDARIFGNPPNMFHMFTLNALVAEDYDLEGSIKALFLVSNAVFDAGISCWDTKRHYDSSRPITAIRCLRAGVPVTAWGGHYQGVKTIDGGSWLPYQEYNFTTPPFSEYTSGHSMFSSAASYVLEKFFGPSFVGPNYYTIPEGQSTFEGKKLLGEPGYIAGLTDVPNSGYNTPGYSPRTDITLSWNTWAEAAQEAAMSRIYGGIHISDAATDGFAAGQLIGEAVWKKANLLFGKSGNNNNQGSSSSNAEDDN